MDLTEKQKECLRIAEQELSSDLMKKIEGIDFKAYDSCGFEFRRASSIASVLLAVRAMAGDDTDRDDVMHEIDGELSGAEAYMEKYRETGEGMYREMAGDELRHAGYLIAMARKHGAPAAALDVLDARRMDIQEGA